MTIPISTTGSTISSARFPVSSMRCRCTRGADERLREGRKTTRQGLGGCSGLSEQGAALRKAKGCTCLSVHQRRRQEIRVAKSLVEFACARIGSSEGRRSRSIGSWTAMLRRAEAGDDAFRQQHQLRAAQLKESTGSDGRCSSTMRRARLAGSRAGKTGMGGRSSPTRNLKPASGSGPIIGLLVSARG